MTHTLHTTQNKAALDTSVINNIVRRVSFFKTLQDQDSSQALLLLSHSKLLNVSAGELIFNRGQAAPTVYFILSGSVEVFSDSSPEARLLGTIAAGETFGEMALFNNDGRVATIKASPHNTRGTKLLACDFSMFGGIDDFSSLSLSTKLLFMRQLVQRAEWRLVKNRIRFPNHQFFQDLKINTPEQTEQGSVEELFTLHKQVMQLNDALVRWNDVGESYHSDVGGITKESA